MLPRKNKRDEEIRRRKRLGIGTLTSRNGQKNTKDYNANTASVPYILDEFSYYFETAYDVTNASFPDCAIDRPSGASASGRMGIVNHMLHIEIFGIQIPNEIAAGTTNSAGSIGSQASLCEGLYGRAPNVVLVSCAPPPPLCCPLLSPFRRQILRLRRLVLTGVILLAGLCELGRCDECSKRAQWFVDRLDMRPIILLSSMRYKFISTVASGSAVNATLRQPDRGTVLTVRISTGLKSIE